MLDHVSLGLSYGHICPIRPIRSCRGRHVHANHRPGSNQVTIDRQYRRGLLLAEDVQEFALLTRVRS